MSDENKDFSAQENLSISEEILPVPVDNTELAEIPRDLNAESKALIEQIIAETDEQKSKDLTQLFNRNQNKKTMVRVNKLSELLDTITDQALTRFTARPDEISNKELFDGLKVVQDLIERGQKQVSGTGETPLIQVNQQTNEVNIGDTTSTLSRDSRERVKSAVLGLLDSLNAQQSNVIEVSEDDIVTIDESIEEGDE
jgi:hypothetical protein